MDHLHVELNLFSLKPLSYLPVLGLRPGKSRSSFPHTDMERFSSWFPVQNHLSLPEFMDLILLGTPVLVANRKFGRLFWDVLGHPLGK